MAKVLTIKFKVYVKFNISLNLNFCEWRESIKFAAPPIYFCSVSLKF